MRSVPSPPITITASMPFASIVRADAGVAVAVDVRVAPRRAEDRAAALEDAAHVVAVERLHVPLHEAVPAVADADDLHAVGDGRAADDRANDRVEPGAVAAGGEDA